MTRITLLLADDHNLIRDGLRLLLSSEPELEIVGVAATGREAVTLCGQLKPNVVIMDLAMPLLNGMEATRQIAANCPSTKIIVLSAYEDDAHLEQVIAAGAAAYLLKHTATTDLIEAIREVHKGNSYFSPEIAERLREKKCAAINSPGKLPAKRPALTVREAEVLQLIAEGFANKQMADELHLSVKTIEKHRQSLMQKLNIHCTADLVRHAAAKGFIDASGVKAILA